MFRKFAALVCLWIGSAWSQPAAAPRGITGEWSGTIAGKLRVILRVDRVGDSLHASLESIDQGHAKIDVDEVSFDGKKSARFEMKKIDAGYEAELNPDGSELIGVWQQGGSMAPLRMRRADAGPEKAFRPAVRGKVSLTPCVASDGGQGLCGTWEVYENRATRTGRKIGLHLIILPSFEEKPAADPIFGFAGGPGQSAVEAFPLLTAMAALRQKHDLVLIDQRGTGKSNPLRCALDESDPQALLNGPSSVKDLAGCRKDLETKADLVEYTTSNHADDVDEVREALGYGKIDVLGGSYGTLAALVYVRRHGEHVRAMVLEGVASPDYRLPLPFAKTIQASLDHLFANCAADPGCQKSFPDLKTEFETIVERLEEKPAAFEFNHKPVTLTRGVFVSDLRPLLYQPAIVSRLPHILHRAFEGDFTPFVTLAIFMHRAVNQSVARGMAFSVGCSESVPFISEADIQRDTGGTYLGDFDVRTYQKNCGSWPHARLSADFLDPVHSDVPSLLITGAEDPATPPSWAEHAAAGLSHSRVVAIPHGTHLTQSLCIDHMIVEFVNQGVASGIDTGCVNQIHNPPFFKP